jgi:hypothetical protein
VTGAGVARVAHPALVQQTNPLTSDKVAAMFVFHPVSPLVTRAEVNYPPESRIPAVWWNQQRALRVYSLILSPRRP